MKNISAAVCCRAMTVDCLACAAEKTVKEYCAMEENQDKEGCKCGKDKCLHDGMHWFVNICLVRYYRF